MLNNSNEDVHIDNNRGTRENVIPRNQQTVGFMIVYCVQNEQHLKLTERQFLKNLEDIGNNQLNAIQIFELTRQYNQLKAKPGCTANPINPHPSVNPREQDACKLATGKYEYIARHKRFTDIPARVPVRCKMEKIYRIPITDLEFVFSKKDVLNSRDADFIESLLWPAKVGKKFTLKQYQWFKNIERQLPRRLYAKKYRMYEYR